MSLERIRLNGGHLSLSIGGHTYLPDESGAFEVPSSFAAELIRIHGGEVDPGASQLEEAVIRVEAELEAAEYTVKLKRDELRTMKDRLEQYKARAKVNAEQKAAASPASTTLTANNGKPPQQNQQSPRR